MKNELEKVYKISPLFEHFNEKNILKPFGYQHMFNYVANTHLKDTNQGVGVVIDNRYAWVLVSFTMEIYQAVSELVSFNGRTWFTGNTGPYYRREYELKDDNGELVAVAASYSVLLDMETRTVYRQKELPFEKLTEININLLEAKTRFRENEEFDQIHGRKVYNSHLDNLGHVNNLRYTEYIYDAFTEEEVELLPFMNKYELYFHNEMKLNNEFSVEKHTSSNKMIFNINNKSLNEKAFSAVFHYNKGLNEF